MISSFRFWCLTSEHPFAMIRIRFFVVVMLVLSIALFASALRAVSYTLLPLFRFIEYHHFSYASAGLTAFSTAMSCTCTYMLSLELLVRCLEILAVCVWWSIQSAFCRVNWMLNSNNALTNAQCHTALNRPWYSCWSWQLRSIAT